MEIEQLQRKLPDNIYKSIKANFDSCKTLLKNNKNDIEQITKLNSEDVDLVLQTVAHIYVEDKLKEATSIPEWGKIATDCKVIDELLHGGIPINGINELYGESGVGKTQFCLQLALMVQLPKTYGGLGRNAVYICTEDPFPSKRLRQLGQLFLKQYKDVGDIDFENNIFVEHIGDFEQLRICLYVKLYKLIQRTDIGLIIIDSIAGVFRSYNENTNYQTRSEEFQTISRKLYELCNKYGIGVLCTNQISDNLETGETDPCLGFAWSNWVTSRFCITRSFNRKVRKFKIVFAPHLSCGDCDFFIEENGIVSST